MGKKELPIEWDINEKERFKELIKDIRKRSADLAQGIKDKVMENLEQFSKIQNYSKPISNSHQNSL